MSSSSAPTSHFLSSRILSSGFAMPIAAACSLMLLAVCSVSALAQTLAQDSSSLSDKTFLTEDLASLSLAPAPVPQYGENGPRRRYPPRAPYQDQWSRVALEAGGGFTAPAGSTQHELTYGWNFRGGLGYKFSRDLSLMAEYSFDRSKIPGTILSQVGEPGGNVHIWSLTLDPVLYYKTTGAWGGYITGGGGFYRKVTSFTQPVLAFGTYCDFFYCYPYQYTTNVTVAHFSSNQGGANLGTGFTFGGWNSAKFYTEARYEWLDTPGRSTQIIPVTFGIRF